MDVGSVKRIHQSDWTNRGVRFLRARDIVALYNNIEPDNKLYISVEQYNDFSNLSGKVKINDMLVTGVGTIGVPYLIKNDNPIYFKDGNVLWLKNNNAVVGDFLYYSYTTKYLQDYIVESAGVGTVGTYTITTCKTTPIYLPTDKVEQQKIGNFFREQDEAINAADQQIRKLKTIKRALMDKMFA